jgi:hypothetical protein
MILLKVFRMFYRLIFDLGQNWLLHLQFDGIVVAFLIVDDHFVNGIHFGVDLRDGVVDDGEVRFLLECLFVFGDCEHFLHQGLLLLAIIFLFVYDWL